MAATRALALLAKEDVPNSVAALYGLRDVQFGAEYLIPFPFDPRVLLWVAPAVAWAAVASGAANEFVDIDDYRERLESRLGRARGVMRGLINRAISNPKRVVFPEGEEPKIIRAAYICVEDGIAMPILLGDRKSIEQKARAMNIPLDEIVIEDPATSRKREEYAQHMWAKRQRKGMSLDEARRRLYNGNYFGSCMVVRGDADALVSGVNLHYPETIRPALEVIGAHPKAGLVSGMYMLVFEKQLVFCADTTVNIDPTAEQLAQIAYSASAHRAHDGHRAAHRDAVVLELRVGPAPGDRKDGARRRSCCASAIRRLSSTARCRPTRRSTRRSSRGTTRSAR